MGRSPWLLRRRKVNKVWLPWTLPLDYRYYVLSRCQTHEKKVRNVYIDLKLPEIMAVPKPLPRTRVRNQPVIVISHNVETSKSNEEVVEYSLRDNEAIQNDQLKPRIPPPRSKKNAIPSPRAREQIRRGDTFEKYENSSSPQTANGEEKFKTQDELIDSIKTANQDNEEEESRSTPEDNDQEENSVEADEDDDELVVNEILKFKKSSLVRKKLLDGEITSSKESSRETSASSSSSRTKILNDDANAVTEIIDEDIVGIHIHRADCLKMDRIIKHPLVVVHIVDADNNGTYLTKSKPDKNVTYNQETSSFILPVMTRPFSFKDHQCIIAQWEEALTFNENTTHIIKPSTIFFFEVVDFIDSSNSDADYSSIGWYRIAWAFLKPIGANNVRNLGKILRLQLYQSDQKDKSINKTSSNVPYVYNLYRKKQWKPYPSTLYVTVTTISSRKVDSTPRQRSCTPLQPEIGSDSSVKSLALFSSGDDSLDAKSPETLSAIYRLSNIEWNRLPGQSCRIPNMKIATLHPDPRGSLAVKFSHSGLFLACGTNADIFIYAVDGILERKLTNHQGLIYTLSWFTDDSLLLSASADCTACIWDMKSMSENPLQILPHPSFVYCSTFIYPEQTIVTGCYDGIVRIWWHTHASSRFWQLHQELTGHEEYVSAVCSFRNKEFFSSDSCGLIIHWVVDESARWFKMNVVKTLEIRNTIINKLVVFPGEKRLLIHTRDSLLRTMDIKSTAIIQWYQGGLNDTSQCNSVLSPCGSLVFASSEDGTVNVWESNTAKHLAFYSSGNIGSGCGGTIDYHPFDHICAFSSYSTGSSSSPVNLLKYSATCAGSNDVMLYMLNGPASLQYEPGYGKKNFNAESHPKKGKLKNADTNKSSRTKK